MRRVPLRTLELRVRSSLSFAPFLLAALITSGCADTGTGEPEPAEPDVAESCPSSQCSNHGTCTLDGFAPVCECLEGYTGETCAECDTGYHRDIADNCLIDETCNDLSCDFGGTCVIEAGVAVCLCDEGWTGSVCGICAAGFHDENGNCLPDETCLANTCSGRGTCRDESGIAVCDCDPGFGGDYCDEDTLAPTCATDDPCGEHGTCDDETGAVLCTCQTGYSGSTCEDCYPGYHREDDACVLDEICFETTCLGNGVCSIEEGSVLCACYPGYGGPYCDVCAEGFHRNLAGGCVANQSCADDNPCLGPGGTCDDSSGRALCACDAGYAGASCQVCYPGYHRTGDVCELDEYCREATCGEGGVCDDPNGVIACTCANGFEGEFCQTNIDDCLGLDCGTGECLDLVGEATCHCADGTYRTTACP